MRPPEKRNNAYEMHPDDRKALEEGEAYAKEKGPAFCEQFRAEIDRLVTEYGDGMAEQMLMSLREKFWLRGWEKQTPTQG